ncbi:hypothetical protein X798_01186 [Onchocerca flexuosa]|uniref:Uncharacterized protein n=1 Tax=Onchocerca flexuosa TaxID=387005 RepID=A0A238C4D5_9BILA|nr:hypothetical protein X798_01186 [Onchocerca flexuosa]
MKEYKHFRHFGSSQQNEKFKTSFRFIVIDSNIYVHLHSTDHVLYDGIEGKRNSCLKRFAVISILPFPCSNKTDALMKVKCWRNERRPTIISLFYLSWGNEYLNMKISGKHHPLPSKNLEMCSVSWITCVIWEE